MIPFEWLKQVESRIAPYIQSTPPTYDAARNLYIKWENRQVTDSFKARGAFNKVLMLEAWGSEVGLAEPEIYTEIIERFAGEEWE